MVNFKKLSDRAKDIVEKRGGTDALKDDLNELKGIATGKGSVSDKAKAAAAALKDPGQRAGETPIPDEPADAAPVPDPAAPDPGEKAARSGDPTAADAKP